MNLSVRLSQPSASGSSSEMLAAFDRQVTAQPAVPSQGPQPESTGAVVRSLGKSSHGASGSEDSDDSLAEVAVARKSRSKRFRRFSASQSSSSEIAVWPIDATAVDIHAPSVGSNQHSRSSIASPPVVESAEVPAEDCLDGSSVVEHYGKLHFARSRTGRQWLPPESRELFIHQACPNVYTVNVMLMAHRSYRRQ